MKNKVCWIDAVGYENGDEKLREIYGAVLGPGGTPDNLYQAFSLRPHTIKPADDLYRATLHHQGNELPKWFSELIGTYVAILTGCEYALTHHGHNFACLLGDTERSERIVRNLKRGNLIDCGDAREVAVLRWARKLCLQPESMSEADVEALADKGWSDGEILEIVQIVAMFSYFVRVINGLGISTQGERVGFY